MERGLKVKDLELEGKEESVVEQILTWAVVEEEEGLETFKMPRPCRRRRVGGNPNSNYFKPAGIRIIELQEVVLAMDEFEALRLKDFQDLDQDTAAEKMNISQPTFHRILLSARKKVSDAIINGKAIKIEGKNYE